LGAMSTLNPPEEVELAEKLLQLHPWSAAARFARTGGEVAAVAVRLARAATRRSLVAVCGYHGWHDWYLAANLGASSSLDGHLLPGLDPLGVPRELSGTTLAFRYNDLDGLSKIVAEHGADLAAVVMEPCRHHPPKEGFLEGVREITRGCGALLVFDEITIGWRLAAGGAHLRFGVEPDLAFFAKALGNGHPIAAVIGTEAAMAGAHESFISSTYWTESIGPTAALATLARMEQMKAREHIDRAGSRIKQIWQTAGAAHGLPVRMGSAFNCLLVLQFDHPEAQALKTLYTQEMLQAGFLAGPGVFPTLAHDDAVLELFAGAVDLVFERMGRAARNGNIQACLKGPEAHSGFRRLL
ncbi:MAG: aminotransferase class III-fold pyridoxal phosphate-dependent enzyme, partial [Lentisphaerae bacterium]|nr:aminotransferase class III-fold pyridoxal phosphate-dependent enzyme [Lentisphaerota bacterium]